MSSLPASGAPRAAILRRRHPGLSANVLTVLASLLFAAFYSLSFWRHLSGAELPPGLRGGLFLVAAGVVVLGFNSLLLSLVAWRWLQKPALAAVILLSASAAYFMDGYGAVVDRHALQSVLETNLREGSGWLSWRMAAYLAGLGVLPVLVLAWVPVHYRPWPRELLARLGFMAVALLAIGLAVLPFSREMASTARNHAELRHLATPANLFNAVRGYLKHAGPAAPATVTALGADVRPGPRLAAARKPLLLVLVIGESARASSFSLGGYGRDTNPELARAGATYFSNVTSCGTNTATSLPCLFSNLGREGYRESTARASENLVDVLAHGGFAVEWEDNNTGSKSIAIRQKEEDMANFDLTGLCDDEGCLDEILVQHLRAELAGPGGDKVFVLHMIGSHGPAYFKRYPKAFERFTPACASVALQECTQDEIRNSYDNTILYTDHVLARLIALLDENAVQRPSALLFVSDHGESTGERGLYLHGAPYLLAPQEQTRVPMLLWTSEPYRAWRGLDPGCTAAARDRPLSHDHFFHTVLGLLDLRTRAYRPGLDALAGCAAA